MFNIIRKHKLWYIYFKGIPGSGENEWARATHFNMDESHNAELKKTKLENICSMIPTLSF